VIPTIIQLGPLPIHSFGMMIALMFIACVYLLGDSFEEAGVDRKLAEKFVFSSVIFGLLGARVWYLIENISTVKNDIWGAVISGAGFTFYGGFVVSILVVIFLCRKHKIPAATFFDNVGPTLALGYAIGRLGCQLAGDGDYGFTTTSFLGMSYATGVVPTAPGVLAFPTPLFESLISILICHFLLSVRNKPSLQAPFKRWGLYLLLISSERFFIEFFRINERFSLGFSEAQYFSIAFCLIALCFLLRPVKASRA